MLEHIESRDAITWIKPREQMEHKRAIIDRMAQDCRDISPDMSLTINWSDLIGKGWSGSQVEAYLEEATERAHQLAAIERHTQTEPKRPLVAEYYIGDTIPPYLNPKGEVTYDYPPADMENYKAIIHRMSEDITRIRQAKACNQACSHESNKVTTRDLINMGWNKEQVALFFARALIQAEPS